MRKFIAAILALTMLLAAVPFASAEASMANFGRTEAYAADRFTDVKATDWFAESVQNACELGLMRGSSETEFSPDKTLTAAEALVIACRLHSIYKADGAEFVQGQPWYQVYVDYALEQNIVREGLLQYEQPISREQFAYVMCGAIPSAELEAINAITDIPDVTEQSTYGGFVYRLYNAGVLTGNNKFGVFTPKDTIHRDAVAAIVTRMADKTLRKTFTLAAPVVEAIETAGIGVIKLGQSTTWTATAKPFGVPAEITWTAGNPTVATVDENGVITAHKPGRCDITAAAGEAKKTVTLTVISDPVEDLQLAGKVEVRVGDSITWTAKVLPETALQTVTWTAGNPGVATVDANGVITGHKSGTCNITATATNGLKKTVAVKVKSDFDIFCEQNYSVLGSYDSPHVWNPSRTNNLILACKAIDGTVLQPGDVFSFNKTVGQRTAAKGYQSAAVYIGGNTEPQLGGGICQVASTIYMAALLADLKIVERTEHMFKVTYVPLGMDATVYWGSLDFKFKNSTSNPLAIRASVSDGKVHIKLLGTPESENTIKMTYATGDGYHVQTYKNYYDKSGKLLSTVKCAYSSYQPHSN